MTVPCARAAHAACSNENLQMVVYGGSTGSGMLAGDELYILDHKVKDEEANWSTWSVIPTSGKSPGKRYGHTLCYLKPYIVLFGGNTGSAPANDTWIINLDKSPFIWTKLDIKEDSVPSPRLYHAAGVCAKGNAQGMMIIFGGRDSSETALNDSWGLRRHRNGTWDWVLAPYKSDSPKQRYNHSLIFVGSLMVVTGGRGRNIQDVLSTDVYDTELSEWKKFSGVGLYRHSCFMKDTSMYIYGGFENSNPNYPVDKLVKIDLLAYFASNSSIVNKIEQGGNINTSGNVNSAPNNLLPSNSNYNQGNFAKLHLEKENISSGANSNILLKNNMLNFNIDNNVKQEQKFRLASQAVVVKFGENSYDDMGLIRKVSIDKLNDEAKRIGYQNTRNQLNPRRIYNEDLVNKVIDTFLRPFDWYTSEVEELHRVFPLSIDEIDSLINEAAKVIPRDQTLVRLRSPAKVFGNIYGQYNDLMRFFESYGHPSDDNTMGDIHLLQYVFLGDFCDRGNYSLEVILLLLALKVRYPDHIYIVRGHHEDISINAVNGLGEECEKRLDENIRQENSIFMKLNALFELLPLAVIIDNKILCVHGGIGSSVSKLSDISSLKRPIQVVQDVRTHEQQILLDLLWSEYSDDIPELAINEERDITKSGFILKYGKDRLNKFLSDNKLVLMITAHQWVAEGIKLFNNDKLLTVISSTNYMDKFNNIGGMVYITKNSGQIIPKLIDIFKNEKKNYKPSKNISPVRKGGK